MEPLILLSNNHMENFNENIINNINPNSNNFDYFKIKLNEVIENSNSMFEMKTSLILSELLGLKKEHNRQLKKLTEFFTNPGVDKNISSRNNSSNSVNSKINSNLNKNKSMTTINSAITPPPEGVKYKNKFTPNTSAKKKIINNKTASGNISKINISNLSNKKDPNAKKNSLESTSSFISTNNNTVSKKTASVSPIERNLSKIEENKLLRSCNKSASSNSGSGFIKHIKNSQNSLTSINTNNSDKKILGKKTIIEYIQKKSNLNLLNNINTRIDDNVKGKKSPEKTFFDVKDERKFSILDIVNPATFIGNEIINNVKGKFI
jgi:hypothetical protein